MISLSVILIILFTHWFADFVMQSDWMAKNKSKANIPLLVHVLVYGSIFFIPSIWLFPTLMQAFSFAVINTLLHFSTDYFTSRITSALWTKGKVHWFFTVIGFDQFLHYAALFITYLYIIG